VQKRRTESENAAGSGNHNYHFAAYDKSSAPPLIRYFILTNASVFSDTALLQLKYITFKTPGSSELSTVSARR
jgi:hypothetical protein